MHCKTRKLKDVLHFLNILGFGVISLFLLNYWGTKSIAFSEEGEAQ